jgi:RecB family exonuclease
VALATRAAEPKVSNRAAPRPQFAVKLDGLILLRMPMLWPSTWMSFGVMLAVTGIVLYVVVSRRASSSFGRVTAG